MGQKTGRPASGQVDWRRNPKTGFFCWFGRFTINGKRTPFRPLPGCTLREDQREEAKGYAAKGYAAHLAGTAPKSTRETVSEYVTRWLKSRTRARTDNKSHLETHVLPLIGRVAMTAVTSEHGDKIVAALDAKIAAKTMSDKTARNVWGTARRLFREAAHAKPSTGLRCLEANPFRDVAAPERSRVKRALQFLYPSEFLAFVSCDDVPRKWKRNAAIAVYLGLRDGEQRSLRWTNVDLAHGIVHVQEVWDKETKAGRDGTKTGAARAVPIPEPLRPLLAAMHKAAGGKGLVCSAIYSQRAMARGLRTWLKKADVDRPQLHDRTDVNLPIRWHDLRGTCATWLAVQGRNATEIRDVLGHTQTSMTDRYMRNAQAVRGGAFGEVFPALPETLWGLGLVSDRSESKSSNRPKKKPFMAGWTGLEPAASGVTGRRYNQLNYHPELSLFLRCFLVHLRPRCGRDRA